MNNKIEKVIEKMTKIALEKVIKDLEGMIKNG